MRFVKTIGVLAASFFAMPLLVASAQGGGIENPLGPGNLTFIDIINRISTFAVQIGAPIAVIVILYAGVLFMFSGGDVEKVKRAKRALTWALVGLAIVLTGKGIILIIQDVLRGGNPAQYYGP